MNEGNMKQVVKKVAGFVLIFNVVALFWVVTYSQIPVSITKQMVIAHESAAVSYKWKDLDQISQHLQLAVMCAEDQKFLLHSGLDFQSIEEAQESNAKGKQLKGASTITQQVAKNVFLWPNRSWLRKLAELYFALLIEVVWSKERIMEVYLNVAEMGEGIFGAEAASQSYFKKSAQNLSRDEAARIAAVLPNPTTYSVAQPSFYVRKRTAWIKLQMKQWGNEMTYDASVPQSMMKR